jgi:hypothetical protein
MRLAKALGLAAMLALSTTALAVPAPASAVTMCMQAGVAETKTCPEGKRYLERKYKAKLKPETKAKLTGAIVAPECTESTVTWETTGTKVTPLPGKVLDLTLGGCDTCTGQAILGLPYKLAINSSGDGTKDGSVLVSTHSEGGPPGIKLTGCGTITCEFGAAEEKIDLEFIGGGTGQALVLAKLEPFQYIGGTPGYESVCGKTAKFTATYEMIEPTEAWVTAFP